MPGDAKDVGKDYMDIVAGNKKPEDSILLQGNDKSDGEKPSVDADPKKAEEKKSGDLDMTKIFDGKYTDLNAASLAWTEQERTLGRVTTEAKTAQTKLTEMTNLLSSLQDAAGGDPKEFMQKLRASNIKVSNDKVVIPNFDFPEDFDPDMAKVMTAFMKTVVTTNNQNQAEMFRELIAPLLSDREAAKVKDLVPFATDEAFKPALDNAEADIAAGRVGKAELAAALAVVRHIGDVPAMLKKVDGQKEIEKAKDGALPAGDRKPGDDGKSDDKPLTAKTYVNSMIGSRRG